MRYPKDHKETVRRRIIDVALQKFRTNGIRGSGLKDLAAAVGIQQGSFYNHFDSKEHLVRDSLVDALQHQIETWVARSAKDGSDPIAQLLECLSVQNRDAPGEACTLATLAPEIARQSEPTRAAIEVKIEEIIHFLSQQLPGRDPRERRRQAIGLWSVAMGALQLSRVVTSEQLSREILEGARVTLLSMIDGNESRSMAA